MRCRTTSPAGVTHSSIAGVGEPAGAEADLFGGLVGVSGRAMVVRRVERRFDGCSWVPWWSGRDRMALLRGSLLPLRFAAVLPNWGAITFR